MTDILMTASSATALALPFLISDMHFVAWGALVPLFLLIRRSGIAGAFFHSFITALLFFCGMLWWGLGMKEYHAANFIVQNLATALFYGVFGVSACYFQRKVPHWNIFTFPAIWVLLEYLRSNMGFLSWPWGILGYSQHTVLAVARISAYAGVYGVSFLIVAVNAVIAEMIFFQTVHAGTGSHETLSLRSRNISISILCVLVLVLFLSFINGSPAAAEDGSTRSLKVAIIQGNDYARGQNDQVHDKDVLRKYNRYTLRAADAGPDLITWPEASVPGIVPYNPGLVFMLSSLALRTDAFLLVGTSGYDKFDKEQREAGRTANSAFLFSPSGKMLERYDKMRLLPFNEYVPVRNYIKWPEWLASTDMIDAVPGKKMTVFEMDRAKFAVLICWENLFPGQFREAAAKGVDFMVSMTNEAFTDSTVARSQILAMNVFRAIENHVSVVRTAATGISAVIGPDGRVAAAVEDRSGNSVNVEGFVVKDIALSTERTFYNRYGEWFIGVLIIALTGLTIFSSARRKDAALPCSL